MALAHLVKIMLLFHAALNILPTSLSLSFMFNNGVIGVNIDWE